MSTVPLFGARKNYRTELLTQPIRSEARLRSIADEKQGHDISRNEMISPAIFLRQAKKKKLRDNA